ncbi:predicted protein [Lichtheimia corymbifera JMRC:FSU:9682]|uniref:Uncharacterized protein n=1 Tax=Lichtheimia corymbifera JMRC:FSU:9682 TaxID=1263082 RepID=A0A068RXL1_9FUNG|nr:predicted protein [Lichtheimia corymbifera JMRC:FSU:9682]
MVYVLVFWRYQDFLIVQGSCRQVTLLPLENGYQQLFIAWEPLQHGHRLWVLGSIKGRRVYSFSSCPQQEAIHTASFGYAD